MPRSLLALSVMICAALNGQAADLSQYAVDYSRPVKGKSGRATERLVVSLKRRGVTLRAPSKVPGG